MLNSNFIVIVSLFGLAASIIVMDPINPKLRSGQVLKMRCKDPSSVIYCSWNIREYSPLLTIYPSFGNLEDDECVFEEKMPVTHGRIGVCCFILLTNNPTRGTYCTIVTVLVLPKIQLESEFTFDKNDTMSVMADEESMLTCTVAGARPKPDVLWKIGERQISEGITTNSWTDYNGLVTIVTTLRYTFALSDHGQTVRCIIAGLWIDVEQDEYFASKLLDVMFPPQPQDPITQYGFVEGQTGCIRLNFRSNPPPTRVWWSLKGRTWKTWKIDEPTGLANFSAPNQPSNYEAHLLKYVNGSQTDHEIFLFLNTITKQHADMVYRLSVESILKGQTHEQEYTVYISVDPAPKESVTFATIESVTSTQYSLYISVDPDPLSDSCKLTVTFAIIVAMIILVVIVTVIVCAYITVRWCLVRYRDSTAIAFRFDDEENPGDIVKDEENISD